MVDSPEAKRHAHDRALLWSHVLEWQVDRLRAARPAVLTSHERVVARGIYDISDNQPWWQMEAEKHFALVAGRQLLRALRAFDGDDRLPARLPAAKLTLLRNALEHWDEPEGASSKQMAKLDADAASHEWIKNSGEGFLGNLVTDGALRQWAADVYAELGAWGDW